MVATRGTIVYTADIGVAWAWLTVLHTILSHAVMVIFDKVTGSLAVFGLSQFVTTVTAEKVTGSLAVFGLSRFVTTVTAGHSRKYRSTVLTGVNAPRQFSGYPLRGLLHEEFLQELFQVRLLP